MAKVKNILRRGEYEGVLYAVIDKPSKAGNPMWTLSWAVLVDGKESASIRDWIVKGEKGLWKLEPLAEAMGYQDAIGFNPIEHLEQHVTLILDVDEDGMGFETRNVVTGYKRPRS